MNLRQAGLSTENQNTNALRTSIHSELNELATLEDAIGNEGKKFIDETRVMLVVVGVQTQQIVQVTHKTDCGHS